MIMHCTTLHCVVTSDAHLLLTLQTVLLVVINYGVLVLPLVEFIDLLPRVRRVFERALAHCGVRARADSADEVRGPDPVLPPTWQRTFVDTWRAPAPPE
jgi:hypothetical protein